MSSSSEGQRTETSKKGLLRSSSSGLQEFLRASSSKLLRASSSGISEEKLRLRENKDRDRVWNHYKKENTLSQSKFSSVILVKRRKSRRHWKQWRRDYEIRKDPVSHSLIEKQEKKEQIRKSLSSKNLKKSILSSFSGSSGRNLNSSNVKDKEKKKSMIHQNEALYDRSKQSYFIVKLIRLHKYSKKQIEILKKEISILKALDHPNIVRAFETYEVVGRQLNIVFEYCSGGDLWSRTPVTKEKDVASIMSQTLNAVAFMHERDFIHRDLKMENVLFVSNDMDNLTVKVIDFGLSTKMLPDINLLTQRVGTVYTMSPEVIFRRYTNKADMWSIGVIAYALIADKAPFDDNGRPDEIMKIIEKGKYSFTPASTWDNVTLDIKDFISNLLKFNPDHRFSATQALNHSWMNQNLDEKRPCEITMDKTHQKIMGMNHQGLKRLALYTIASRISTQEVDHIRQVFDQYDTLNNGTICFDEFKTAFAQYQYSDSQLYEIFHRLAFTKSSVIYYTDFLTALLDEQEYIDEDKLADAFDVLDCDDSGYISSENLRHFLDENYNDKEIDSILRDADLNQDGKVSFEDFLAMFDHEREAREEVRRKFQESIHPKEDGFLENVTEKEDVAGE